MPLPVTADKLVEGTNMIDAHQVIDFLTRPREVFADVLFHLHPLLRKLVLHHLFHQRAASSATSRGFGALFYGSNIRGTGTYRLTDITFADVMAGADLRTVRQCRHAEGFWRAPGEGR